MTEHLLFHCGINSLLCMEATESVHIWPRVSNLKKNLQVPKWSPNLCQGSQRERLCLPTFFFFPLGDKIDSKGSDWGGQVSGFSLSPRSLDLKGVIASETEKKPYLSSLGEILCLMG